MGIWWELVGIWCRELGLGALWQPWEAGGRFRREGTYVYLWLIHVDVWQKLTQCCKAIILQLKKNLRNNTKIKSFPLACGILSFPTRDYTCASCTGSLESLPLLRVRLVAQLCPTLCDPMGCSPPGSSVHADSPGKNTGVGCHFLLQGIFPTQGLNLHLLCFLYCRWILYPLSHWESHWTTREVPDILLWDERILWQAPRHFTVTRKSASCCEDLQHLDHHNLDRAGFK